MIIDRNITRYTIDPKSSIRMALERVVSSKTTIVFVVNSKMKLLGLLTNGDILRWLIQDKKIDLEKPVSSIYKTHFVSVSDVTQPEKIRTFLERINYLPVVDKEGYLKAVARRRNVNDAIHIGPFTVHENAPVFIIAEIGLNHNGSLSLAKQLVDKAIEAGADCVKFQMRDMKSLYHNKGDANDIGEDLGSQYTLDVLSHSQLSVDQMAELFNYCKGQRIFHLCSPWDKKSVETLESMNMSAYKVASADLTNHDLLEKLAKTGKPLICSTGMSTEPEIEESVKLLKEHGVQYVLMHCNSAYPAPFKDINLNYMNHLKEIGHCPVGYSGHERGFHIAMAAVAKGAKVIEKHFTLDKSMPGNDHRISLLPQEFRAMVDGIREIELSLGTQNDRHLTQGELLNRMSLAKSLVINCDLKIGATVTEDMIEVRSPGRGLQPNRKHEIIGKKIDQNMKAGDFFLASHVSPMTSKARSYTFKRRWGVPVRYHDFKVLLQKSNPDFLEFHLSYKDIGEKINKHVHQTYNLGLVVHSPDTFTGDFLLNLASKDKKYRQRSCDELQRVIDLTRSLKSYFKKSPKPLIVASLGGFTRDRHLKSADRKMLYDLTAQSLSKLDRDGIEILPQTLPPYPWYFGGQMYLNIFVEAEDTIQFCIDHGYRLCLDISHAHLACNSKNQSFSEFLTKVGPHTAHLHISDARGIDGEGLQIGDGEIDFHQMVAILNQKAPQASFIPEIWQGHIGDGQGFWNALEKLERLFDPNDASKLS